MINFAIELMFLFYLFVIIIIIGVVIKTKCQKCLHEWQARIVRPLACPQCKSYKYNKPNKNQGGQDVKLEKNKRASAQIRG